ncbi:hypothetical protein BDZ91DRAFT_736686 [Kalaharituber pfeilii]|nr:hypothetical protein BDZ91DRAFT_736686 [Kalaharituber pfeilii]
MGVQHSTIDSVLDAAHWTITRAGGGLNPGQILADIFPEGWQDMPCSSFGAEDIVTALKGAILRAGEVYEVPERFMGWVSEDEMLRDTRCAQSNGIDLGLLMAIATLKWPIRRCTGCRFRSAIGSVVWKVPCIGRQCEHLNPHQMRCDCVGANDADDVLRTTQQRRYQAQMRGDVILHAGSVPPRRLWDLVANRVIFVYGQTLGLCQWCLDHNPSTFCLDLSFAAISHSWTNDMVATLTPINAYQWPVPAPAGIDISNAVHQGISFTNVKSRYVWLDVVCLRQQGSQDQWREDARLKEWEVDVPTIGNIYRKTRCVIRYFNGLGLEYDPSEDTWASPRHWTKRAWTLQETRNPWTMREAMSTEPHLSEQYQRYRKTMDEFDYETDSSSGCHLGTLIKEMKSRHASNEIDKIAGLCYLLWPANSPFDLPVYKPSEDIEDVWLKLVRCMPLERKLELLTGVQAARKIEGNPGDGPWLPSWVPRWSDQVKDAVWISRSVTLPVGGDHSVYLIDYRHPLAVPTFFMGLQVPFAAAVVESSSETTWPKGGQWIQFKTQTNGTFQLIPGNNENASNAVWLPEGVSKVFLLCLHRGNRETPCLVCAALPEKHKPAVLASEPAVVAKYSRILVLRKLQTVEFDKYNTDNLFPKSCSFPQREYDAIYIA